MSQERPISQNSINDIWRAEWERDACVSAKELFSQRLFIEGYPVFKKHIPADAEVILDVGAGTGRYGLKLAQDFPAAHVTITDILDESVALVERLRNELGLPNVTAQKEDVFCLSFPDNTFDVVFCDVVIQHVNQPQNAVKEMIRVLKPGGVLIVSAVNTWNIPHSLYKMGQRLFDTPYEYQNERSYSGSELRRLLKRYHMTISATDGFYFAYGIFRWKRHHPLFHTLGRVVNRATKIIDALTYRAVSRYFGFEVFVMGKKHILKVKNCGIVQLSAMEDKERGALFAGEAGKSIPFDIKRVYLIQDVPDYHAVRGGHAHKALDQAIFCIRGSFELRVDDGEHYQKMLLTEGGWGVRLGPKLWHSMRKFSRDCIILVLASDHYEEADYIRDYNEWKKYLEEIKDKEA